MVTCEQNSSDGVSPFLSLEELDMSVFACREFFVSSNIPFFVVSYLLYLLLSRLM